MSRRSGCGCRAKLNCLWVHTLQLQQWANDEQVLLRQEVVVGYCDDQTQSIVQALVPHIFRHRKFKLVFSPCLGEASRPWRACLLPHAVARAAPPARRVVRRAESPSRLRDVV